MNQDELRPTYKYAPSFISEAKCVKENGYLLIEIEKGTVLYHGSKILPITLSASGKTAVPDMLYPNAYFADESHSPMFGFSFAFALTKPIRLFDLNNRWNLLSLVERSDMDDSTKQLLGERTGFGIRDLDLSRFTEDELRRAGKYRVPYRNKPRAELRMMQGNAYVHPINQWLADHDFQGAVIDRVFLPTHHVGIRTFGSTICMANPSEYVKPKRIVIDKLDEIRREALFCETRITRGKVG